MAKRRIKTRVVYRDNNMNLPEDVQLMKQEIQRLKVAKELEALKSKNENPKDEYSSAKQELKELYKQKEDFKKANSLKGKKGFARFGGFIGNFAKTAHLNQQINQRSNLIKQKQQLDNLKLTNNIAEQRAKLNEARIKSTISYEDLLYGKKVNPNSKQVRFEDLY